MVTGHAMRTTLNIADDVLAAVQDIAERESKPVGAVVSTLIRQALPEGGKLRPAGDPSEFGFRPFPQRGVVVTNELIDRLREDAGD